MVLASDLRSGMAVRYEKQVYKVMAAEYHPGQGKMGGVTHVRLKNLETGTLWEHSLRSDLKLEEVPLERKAMDFLYADADAGYFMDPESFEQIAVPLSTIGPQAKFLLPEKRFPVEFVEGRPVSVQFPDLMEVRIAGTAPPAHQQVDSAWKSAKLENGVEVMVPQFIKTGDAIRVDLATLRYVDRVKK
jgi:elongation factor P